MAAKKRLVDADEAKEALLGWETDPTDEEIEYTIDNLPTVDAVEVDTAALVAIQIALEAIRQWARVNGCDPVFDFSPPEVTELADYIRELLHGCSEMEGDGNG